MATDQSYPIDHHSPAIRHGVSVSQTIEEAIGPFLAKPITASNLRSLGDRLAPSKDVQKCAKLVANKVQAALKECRESDVSIARTCVSGSFGKKTALASFDIDLVLFLNGSKPPFERELAFFHEFLPRQLTGLKMLKSSPFSVTFLLDGFKVDLLPAPNLVSGTPATPRIEQHSALLREISGLPAELQRVDYARTLSPAFSETIVSFMAKQQPFVNAAIRLGKLWKKSCAVTQSTFPRWFSSFLVESIMCDVAKEELERCPQASLVRVFKGFLRLLSEPQTINIVCTDYYVTSAVPKALLRERPLVVDPANPYLNLAKQMTWKPIRLLALDTLTVLERIERDNVSTGTGALFQHRLGEDVPRLFRLCRFQLQFVKGGSWLRQLQMRSIEDLGGKEMDQGVIWRDPTKLERNPASLAAGPSLLAMLEEFVAVSNLALAFHVGKAVQSGETEVPAVARYMDTVLHEVFDLPIIGWIPTTTKRTEDFDVSLIFGQVPVRSFPGNLRYIYICYSFNVDDNKFDYMCHAIADAMRRQACEAEE